MAEYVCIRKCFHKGKLWLKGDTFVTDDENVPHHFSKKGTPVPEDQTPRLGAIVKGKTKLPSVKAPGKEDFKE